MPVTDYLQLQWLKHLLQVAPYTAPASTHLEISTTNDFGFDGTGGTEPAGYTRPPFSWSAAVWHNLDLTPNPLRVTIQGAAALSVPAELGTVRAIGVRDAASGGNLLGFENSPS